MFNNILALCVVEGQFSSLTVALKRDHLGSNPYSATFQLYRSLGEITQGLSFFILEMGIILAVLGIESGT